MGLFFIQEERKISCENANLGVGEMIPVQICISALIDWISNVEAKKFSIFISALINYDSATRLKTEHCYCQPNRFLV